MTESELIERAYAARQNAYVPYSNYRVGAAILCDDGTVFTGCNIENAAYGNTLCAERTALVKAVSEGYRSFQMIAITAEGTAPYPCGACRQSLVEFSPDIMVLVAWDYNHVVRTSLAELLPNSFDSASFGGSKLCK